MALNPIVQFKILDDLTNTPTDKGYTLDIYKFRFEVDKDSIPDYIADHDFIWQFGDGTFSSETSPTHWYKAPGIYEISLQLVGVDENKKYTIYKNGITKTVHIYNFTPDYEYNVYSDFISYIDTDGLSPISGSSLLSGLSGLDTNWVCLWDRSPVITFGVNVFTSWQTYEINKGINKVNLNVDKSLYPLLNSDVYNSHAYSHLAATDKFIDDEDQPINSVTIKGTPIYITRNKTDGLPEYIDYAPGATFIGTSATCSFRYSGNPSLSSDDITAFPTIIEVSLDEAPFRVNYDVENNINNAINYPIMLSKPYGFKFYNILSYEDLNNKVSGYITSSGIDSELFDIFTYKYKGLPINFIFRNTIPIDTGEHSYNYPISFIRNLKVQDKDDEKYYISFNDSDTPIGDIQINYLDSDFNERKVPTSSYNLISEEIQQPSPYNSEKGGYLKGIITYNTENSDVYNCFITISLSCNVITKEIVNPPFITQSNSFNIIDQTNTDIRKINEDFSLAEQYHKNNLLPTLNSHENLDNFVDTLYGNVNDPNSFTVKTFERISNYISNLVDIDTCTIDTLYDRYYMMNLYIADVNYIYPPNFRRVIDLFSINLSRLKGFYNYYNIDFDKKGYIGNVYGKNKGNLLDINTYNITAGVNILAKEKFSEHYSIINTNLIVNHTDNLPLSDLNQIYQGISSIDGKYVYPLKNYKLNINTETKELSDIGWGWNLILPPSFKLSDYYEFYEYIPSISSNMEILGNLLDLDNKYSTIQLSDIDNLDNWSETKTKYISQTLYSNLIIS